MRLFIVLDTKGCGRVLGVFDERLRAEEITLRYPHYYLLHVVDLKGKMPSGATGRPCLVDVVLDTMGHVRPIAVMARRRSAQALVRKSPAYCRIHECTLNRINPEALAWVADDGQRQFIADRMQECGRPSGRAQADTFGRPPAQQPGLGIAPRAPTRKPWRADGPRP